MALGIAFMLIYAGFNVSAVLTAGLATDKTALSTDPDCGIYEINMTYPREFLRTPVEYER
jgi:hypothetical protein